MEETYDSVTLNSYLLPQYFEYAHMHSYFDYFKTHHFGVWEDGSNIVGIACYEMRMGDCHMHVRKEYEALRSPVDLAGRIVPHKDYERLWRKRCMEMIEICVPYAVKAGKYKDDNEARTAMQIVFSGLKRWEK